MIVLGKIDPYPCFPKKMTLEKYEAAAMKSFWDRLFTACPDFVAVGGSHRLFCESSSNIHIRKIVNGILGECSRITEKNPPRNF